MTQITLRLLGSPRLERDKVPVVLPTRKAIALLARLALADAPLPRERLMDLLWPDTDQARAQGDLRRALTSLRQALGGDAVDSNRQTVRLNPENLWVDVTAFRELIRETNQPVNASMPRIARLEEAVALWRDDFLAGLSVRDSATFDDWQSREGERLHNELAAALQELTRLHSDAGSPSSAITHTRRWLALDPLREDAHCTLMRLYAQTGRRADALRQYQDCERVLAEELGVPPLEETTALYRAIKDEQPVNTRAQAGTPVKAAAPALGRLPLVGRESEWAGLLGAQQAWPALGYWIAIEGEAGIGKTRLLDDFAAHAGAIGHTVLRARSYDGEAGLAYEPFVHVLRQALQQPDLARRLHGLAPHWLAELGRLLPELGQAGDVTIVDAGARARLFDAIRQALLAMRAHGPLLLAFDDLHWADVSTVEALIYLVRRLSGTGIALLGTWRSEDSDTTRQLRQALAEALRAGQALHLVPDRLSADQVATLCQASAITDSALGQRLFEESEGVPLLIVEYLQALVRASGAQAGALALPATTRSVLRARVESIDQIERQVLQTAAVIGRSFDAELTQRASGRSDEEIAQALEKLSARGIVRADSASEAPAYDFAHDKLREVVYDDTNLARRMLLHQRVAQSIASSATGKRGGELSGKAARHFEAGGKPIDAAVCYASAGDHARQAFANAEALTHYRAALALGHPDQARLREAVADLLTLRGEYDSAMQNYRQAATQAGGDNALTARLAHAQANVYARLGEWDEAEKFFDVALRASETDMTQSQVLADWSRVAHSRGDNDRALTLAERSRALADGANNPQALARAHNMLGVLARHRNQLELARQAFERSLALARQLADPVMQIAAMNNLAWIDRDAGDSASALSLTLEALRLCEAFGDRHREAALRSNLADLLRQQGDIADAMLQLKQSAVIFAEIGVSASVDARRLQPAVWKLTEW